MAISLETSSAVSDNLVPPVESRIANFSAKPDFDQERMDSFLWLFRTESWPKIRGAFAMNMAEQKKTQVDKNGHIKCQSLRCLNVKRIFFFSTSGMIKRGFRDKRALCSTPLRQCLQPFLTTDFSKRRHPSDHIAESPDPVAPASRTQPLQPRGSRLRSKRPSSSSPSAGLSSSPSAVWATRRIPCRKSVARST